MAKYFDKFPLVSYNGQTAKNILARVGFTAEAKKDIYSNFDFSIQEGMAFRPDSLSNTYYSSPYYDWVIYLSNNVIDPYYDYYMSADDLTSMITQKYGSVAEAMSTIIFYRNNWTSDESLIPTEIYDSLETEIKKYWQPKLNADDYVIGYVRIQEDWIASTNKIVQIFVNDTALFSINQKITQGSARGFVCDIGDTYILVQHVVGAFTNGEMNVGIATSANIISQTITDIEAPFWVEVTAFDHEVEKNELRRHINLMKASYLSDIEKLFLQAIG